MSLRGLLVASLVAMGALWFAPAPRASATPCAPAASGISVAVVVDAGDGSPVTAVCVPAGSSDNGAAVLAARAQQLGAPAPRFDSSGFVCGIDGYPSSGCGEQSGTTYAYWSYWHGTGSSWEYSNVGPGGGRVHADVVEGWRFQPQGAGNPTDPPPNGSSDHTATCAPATTTTTTTIADAPPATTAASTSAAAPAPTTATTVASTTTTTTTTTTTASSSSSQVAAGPVRVTEKGGSSRSSPWAAIGAGVAIVGLVGGGVFAARRRGSP